MPSICEHLTTCLHGGKSYGTPCRNCSTFWRATRTPASAPCSGTGCSATSILTLTGMDAWRFVMNAMLAAGGYPWTVIRVEDRDAYVSALDRANVDMDIAPFTTFVADRVRWSLEHSGPKA